MKLELDSIVAGRYQVLEKVGAGGMAIVYKAKDLKLGRFVTVKVLREEFIQDEDFISRFKTEAQSSACLSHPNIVNVYDVGQEGDVYFIIMEFIEGDTLKSLMQKAAPFSEDVVLDIAGQIASGIQHAHYNKIIHRDIKPQNILVTKDMVIKVTDFGIARAATSATVSLATNAIGSVHYFSPEQARGGYVDEKSDIYSLGIILFEMATGEIPFKGETSVTIALKHLNDEIPFVRAINPKISESLEAIIKKTTAKHVRDRYQSTDELIEDIIRAQNGEKVESTVLDNSFDIESSPTVSLTKEELREIKDQQGAKKHSATAYKKPKQNKKAVNVHEDAYDKSQEIKITIAAIITSLLIIAVISFVGINLLKKSLFAKVLVPDFVGKNFDEANALALEKVLQLSSELEFNNNFAEGIIFHQSEAMNSEIAKNTLVHVRISKGKQQVKVPSLANMLQKNAEELVKESNLKIHVETVTSDNYTKGVVISQYPVAETMVDPSTVVTITVSTGPDDSEFPMVGLIGKSEYESIKTIEGLGLIVGSRSHMESDVYEEGIVIKQSIEIGKSVRKGTIVYLTISSGLIEPSSEESTSAQISSKKLSINASNLPTTVAEVNVRVIQIVPDGGDYIDVHNQRHSISDFPLEITVSGTGTVTYKVYIDNIERYSQSIVFD